MHSQFKNIGRLTLCLLLCLGVGFISGIFTQFSLQDWYPALNKPIGTPPSIVFSIVWPTLYVMMAISLWQISNAKPSKQVYVLFYLQLFFNFIWSFLFFGMQNILLGLIDIILLDISLAATLCIFWQFSRFSAILLFPYFAWVLYATYLNLGLFYLNR